MTRARLLVFTATAFATAVLAIGGYNAHATGDDDDHHEGQGQNQDPRIARGFAIAPVPLTYDKDDHEKKELVGLGSYLVNAVGGCNDCHTQPSYLPGNDPFMGQPKQVNTAHYLGGGQHFGPFVSRNLTPENGLPAGRTYAQFKTELRTGIDLDKAHLQISPLLQVMPWPTYQNMTDHDLRAIYQYLKSIPPATPGS
jgi:hypothetical protein